jgi:chromosomal replication initiator protein
VAVPPQTTGKTGWVSSNPQVVHRRFLLPIVAVSRRCDSFYRSRTLGSAPLPRDAIAGGLTAMQALLYSRRVDANCQEMLPVQGSTRPSWKQRSRVRMPSAERKDSMGRAVAAATVDSRTLAERVRDAVRDRIGDERFAVWFGEACWSERPASSGQEILIRVGQGVTHEWLRRTFRGEVESVVREGFGRRFTIAWEPAPAAGDAPAEHQRRSRSERPLRVHRAAPAADGPQASGERTAAGRRGVRSLGEFVVGGSNRMAFAAVEMAVARLGELSPLVINGPSGVGKTHLLEAACGRCRELHPEKTAVFLSGEQFTTGFLQALHGSGLPGFRRTCRSADLLVIDDLQFFVGKRATIQELQQTIDALQRQGSQVILGCDRELDALAELGPDLVTRLRGGMNARLLPPDYDVRRGIVTAISQTRSVELPPDVVHYIATHMTRHARELLGAINRIEATSLMLGVPPTLDLAREALADLVRSSSRSVRLADVERAVCTAFGIEPGALQSGRRARSVSHPRMLAMFLARKHTHAALSEIGGHFGRRSHSTVVAAQKTVADWLTKGTPVILAETAWDVEEAIRRVEDILRAG